MIQWSRTSFVVYKCFIFITYSSSDKKHNLIKKRVNTILYTCIQSQSTEPILFPYSRPTAITSEASFVDIWSALGHCMILHCGNSEKYP